MMSIQLGMPMVRSALRANQAVPGTGLVDRHGRIATDLRVSLTDKCNLRCIYCMPAEGLVPTPSPQLLTTDEIVKLVGIAITTLGVTQVRFTGGEPLLRADLAEIISRCAAITPRADISLTTNAVGLEHRAKQLAEAGLDRINVSLDTIDSETYRRLARRGFLDKTLAGIDAAQQAGIGAIKLNAVLIRGVNDHQAPALVDWALEHRHQLRFIEQMPLDADETWQREQMVTAAETRALLSRTYALTPSPVVRAGSPAELFDVTHHGRFLGRIGIIASVTEPFCAACTRTRLTADGKIRSCLFAREEFDLKHELRSGATDQELAALWRSAQWQKQRQHGISDQDFVRPSRSMSEIGG